MIYIQAILILGFAALATYATERYRSRDQQHWDTDDWRAGLTGSDDYQGRHHR